MTSQQALLPYTVTKPYKGINPKAYNFIKDWTQNIEVARAYLENAFKKMKKWTDKRCQDVKFKIGDLMLVKLNPEQF